MDKINKIDKINLGINVLSAILIGIASLFVSVASYQVSKQQTEVSKIEHTPFLYISNSYLWDEKGTEILQETLNVHNIGAPVANVSIDIQELLSIEHKNSTGEYVKSILPLVGYYFVNQNTSSPKDLLGKSWGHENYKRVSDLHTDVRKNKYYQKRGVVSLKVIAVVKVEYLNRLREKQVEYFINDDTVGVNEYEEYRKHRESLKRIDIDEITADSLFELLDEIDT